MWKQAYETFVMLAKYAHTLKKFAQAKWIEELGKALKPVISRGYAMSDEIERVASIIARQAYTDAKQVEIATKAIKAQLAREPGLLLNPRAMMGRLSMVLGTQGEMYPIVRLETEFGKFWPQVESRMGLKGVSQTVSKGVQKGTAAPKPTGTVKGTRPAEAGAVEVAEAAGAAGTSVSDDIEQLGKLVAKRDKEYRSALGVSEGTKQDADIAQLKELIAKKRRSAQQAQEAGIQWGPVLVAGGLGTLGGYILGSD